MKSKNIAIAGEITPSKTIIPIIKKLRELENNRFEADKLGDELSEAELEDELSEAESLEPDQSDNPIQLNFKINKIIGLYHGESSKELLKPYCDEVYSIGEGRRGEKKNSAPKLAYLIMRDILKAFNALRGKNIDLLITAGNAGDVRKSIVAAKMLKIPVIHIEQDIYNPIEVISYANIVTVPNNDYKRLLEEKYQLKKVVDIGGYPMVKYLDDFIAEGNLRDKEEIYDEFGVKDFVLAVLGGDLKDEDIEPLIRSIEELNLKVLIAPYRFKKEMVEKLVLSPNVKVLNQYVDLLSFINASSVLIYAAGMGMTIEAALFKKPTIKIEGFHKQHASVDLANELDISIVRIEDIPNEFENLNPLNSVGMLEDGEEAINRIIRIINDFNPKLSKKSGFASLKKIWNTRKVYR